MNPNRADVNGYWAAPSQSGEEHSSNDVLHGVAIGRRIVLGGSVAGTLAAVVAAMAVGIAPIVSAAPSEQHCLEQHCLEAEAPTIRQGPANVQILTSPKAMPAVFPHSNNPKWRGLGYNARWPTLGHNPRWQDFGYDPKWDGFQPSRHIAAMPAPAFACPSRGTQTAADAHHQPVRRSATNCSAGCDQVCSPPSGPND